MKSVRMRIATVVATIAAVTALGLATPADEAPVYEAGIPHGCC